MKSIITSAFKLEMGNLFTHLVDGDDYGQHSHDFYEFFYITSGTITHKLNNRSMVLSEGDFLFIKPTDLHEFVRPASCTHRDIVFSTIFFDNLCHFIDPGILSKIKNFDNTQVIKLPAEKMLYLEKLLDKYNFNLLVSSQTKNTIATTIASEVISEFIEQTENEQLSSAPLWFNKLMDKFNDPIYIKAGIPKILETVKYNEIYVCRIFKKYNGITMTEFLNTARLKYVALKLRSTNSNINEIAESIGFSSPTYFYAQFKKYFGMTPAQYRSKTFKNL